jgi:hypothetical protein
MSAAPCCTFPCIAVCGKVWSSSFLLCVLAMNDVAKYNCVVYIPMHNILWYPKSNPQTRCAANFYANIFK